MSDSAQAYLSAMRQFAAALGRDPARFLADYGSHDLLEDVRRLMRERTHAPPTRDLDLLSHLLENDTLPAVRLAKLSAAVLQVVLRLEDVIALPMVLPLKLQDCVHELRAALIQTGSVKREKETLS
jgi:hypothetical protein